MGHSFPPDGAEIGGGDKGYHCHHSQQEPRLSGIEGKSD